MFLLLLIRVGLGWGSGGLLVEVPTSISLGFVPNKNFDLATTCFIFGLGGLVVLGGLGFDNKLVGHFLGFVVFRVDLGWLWWWSLSHIWFSWLV